MNIKTAEMERQGDLHSKNLLNSLKKLQINGKYCDVTVAVGDKEMKVHKIILVAASEYFEAMFTHETKESQTGKIEFPSTPPEVVKLCMDFIYTGKAEFSLENPEELIYASDMMQLYDLTDLYIEFLIETLNAENFAEYLVLALTFGKGIFKKWIDNFISENCPDFIKAKNFESLSKEHLLYCLKLLPNANETSEFKWKVIITWVKYDSRSRKDSFMELFNHLDLSMISKEFLRDEIYEEQLVKESRDCVFMVLESLTEWQTINSLIVAEESFEFKNLYAVSGSGGALLQYSFVTKEWSHYADMPTGVWNFYPRESFGELELVNGIVYISFGNSLWRCVNIMWTRLYADADENKGKCFNRCVSHGNSVYMVSSADVIQYDFYIDLSYGRISSGPGLGSNFAVTCTSDAIYAMGGCQTQQAGKIVSIYDSQYDGSAAYKFNLVTKTWHRIGNLVSARSDCTAFCLDDKPYVLGGMYNGKNVDSVEFYEPATDRWHVVPDLKITCMNAKVYKRDQLCIVLSGFKCRKVELSKLRAQARKGLMDASADI